MADTRYRASFSDGSSFESRVCPISRRVPITKTSLIFDQVLQVCQSGTNSKSKLFSSFQISFHANSCNRIHSQNPSFGHPRSAICALNNPSHSPYRTTNTCCVHQNPKDGSTFEQAFRLLQPNNMETTARPSCPIDLSPTKQVG